MSRRKKVIRNFIILGVLLFITLRSLGLYLTPISAHEYAERRVYYGPSEVIHVEDYEKGKFLLSKYDKWVSCNEVYRVLFFFWIAGNNTIGFENDKTKAIVYDWSGSYPYENLYGIVNDKEIKKVGITLSNGEIFTQTKFYDNLFLVTWKSMNKEDWIPSIIRGYDENNNVIFEGKL